MSDYKKKSLVNTKKAHSLLKKITEMLEEEKYCIDIMQQNLAVIGLLKSANQLLMEGHLNSCFKNAMKSNNKKRQDEIIKELLQVTKLSGK